MFTGLYFLRPVDEWILAGNKTIETRRYPLEAELVGKKIAMIANGEGNPKSIVGIVSFGASTPYVCLLNAGVFISIPLGVILKN